MASAWVPTEIRRAQLPNALELPYVEQGDEAGLPVVLLHGYADSWRSFERVLSHLPRSIRAIAVTQRGHGEADKPASGYAVTDFAGDLVAFLDVLGLEQAVLVASSSASFTAQRLAIDSGKDAGSRADRSCPGASPMRPSRISRRPCSRSAIRSTLASR